MIDITKLRELVSLMAEHDLAEVEIKNGKESITVKRGLGQAAPLVQYTPQAAGPAAAPQAAPAPLPVVAPGPTIDSPMVGTCYLAANPDSPSFVKIGQQVTPDTTVCLIEAMKVFNEIAAETRGKIVAVLVENGHPVEYGQPLFRVDPAG